jgi:hypothetical protein
MRVATATTRVSDPARAAFALASIAGYYAIEDEATALISERKLSGDDVDTLRLRQVRRRPSRNWWRSRPGSTPKAN